MEEQLEIIDAHGAPAGLAPRARAHREGLWHRAAHVLVFRSDGRLLIQRRQTDKDIYPGAWDLSAAEHLRPGESYPEGAARGLREELGIGDVALEALGGITTSCLELPELGIKDCELQQTFRGVYDGPVMPNRSEVAATATISLTELGAAFAARPDEFTPWFRRCATELGLVQIIS